MLQRINIGGLDVFTAVGLAQQGFMVAFSGRWGGASVGDYAGLNLSYNVGDDPRTVSSNREMLARSLGLPVEKWVLPRQVHGCNVHEVRAEERGRGARDFASGIAETDGLATRSDDVVVGVLTADCMPVAMVAPRNQAVAVAHAGWRGILEGIVVVTARKLAEIGGCESTEIHGFIGPHIGACCMQVDDEVAEQFRGRFEAFEAEVVRSSSGGKVLVDLEAACRRQLVEAGLDLRNIFSTGVCTVCDPGYFSYRGSGGTCGRQGAFAAIVEKSSAS